MGELPQGGGKDRQPAGESGLGGSGWPGMMPLTGKLGFRGAQRGSKGLKGAKSRTRTFPQRTPPSQEETVAPQCPAPQETT